MIMRIDPRKKSHVVTAAGSHIAKLHHSIRPILPERTEPYALTSGRDNTWARAVCLKASRISKKE